MDAQPGLLIIDDESSVLGLLRLVAQRAGLKVWGASSGHEAIQIYAQHRDEIDLVLSDVNMPQLDGPATIARLRLLSPALRFCFMSGFTGSYSAEQLLALGAEHLFDKPFVFDGLGRELFRLATNSTTTAAVA